MFDAILHRFLKDFGMPWGGRGGRRTLKWSCGAGPPRTLLAVFSPGWLQKGPGERSGRILAPFWEVLGSILRAFGKEFKGFGGNVGELRPKEEAKRKLRRIFMKKRRKI